MSTNYDSVIISVLSVATKRSNLLLNNRRPTLDCVTLRFCLRKQYLWVDYSVFQAPCHNIMWCSEDCGCHSFRSHRIAISYMKTWIVRVLLLQRLHRCEIKRRLWIEGVGNRVLTRVGRLGCIIFLPSAGIVRVTKSGSMLWAEDGFDSLWVTLRGCQQILWTYTEPNGRMDGAQEMIWKKVGVDLSK